MHVFMVLFIDPLFEISGWECLFCKYILEKGLECERMILWAFMFRGKSYIPRVCGLIWNVSFIFCSTILDKYDWNTNDKFSSDWFHSNVGLNDFLLIFISKNYYFNAFQKALNLCRFLGKLFLGIFVCRNAIHFPCTGQVPEYGAHPGHPLPQPAMG